MGFSRGVVLVAALALSGALVTGCASGQGTQQTVFVTETGTVPASSDPSATETTSVEATFVGRVDRLGNGLHVQQ